ncbi:hypothetical protein D0Z07_7921 [Hyphodiscus hymeniophilus]|uniref:Uncharacterized protein n=1 Tax=Hyphodiscus hymeniophilus TaxID=353542 RepID=A0A9P6SQW6_9HELO|nr:hypothetical protein D0Z07_7921 [Hyphodiscus hymeniophilus]
MSPSQATAMLDAIVSVEATFTLAYSYTQLQVLVFSAAPTDAQLSLALHGYVWDDILQQTWYQTGVPAAWREKIDAQETAMQSAVNVALDVKGIGERSQSGMGRWGVMLPFGGDGNESASSKPADITKEIRH